MEKTVSIINLAFCGNDCNNCQRYIATKSGDKEQLNNVAIMWHKYGWRDTIVSPEEIACSGCSSATWCGYEIQKCAK